MCPSTPATSTAAVSVAHWKPSTSHSCEVSVALLADCECVVQISTNFYEHTQPSGFAWIPTTWTLARVCAAHADMTMKEPIALQLSLRPSTATGPTERTISRGTALAALQTLPLPSPLSAWPIRPVLRP